MKGTASMTMLADTADAVIGVDTHTDTHTACMLDRMGRQSATVTATADPEGCRMLLAWAVRHSPGPQLAWAMEGTRSHGLGLARMLQARGHVVRPLDPQHCTTGATTSSCPCSPRPDRAHASQMEQFRAGGSGLRSHMRSHPRITGRRRSPARPRDQAVGGSLHDTHGPAVRNGRFRLVSKGGSASSALRKIRVPTLECVHSVSTSGVCFVT